MNAKSREEIVTRNRKLPVDRLVPLSAEEARKQELTLVASGRMRLPKEPLDIDELLKIKTGKVANGGAI
jgi:hypothetical protein